MIRKTHVLILSIILATLPTYLWANHVTTRNVGSAKVLVGHVYVLICFISDKDTEWTTKEKKAMLETVKDGNKFLQTEASKYKVGLHFEYGTFGMEKDIKFDFIEKGTGSGKERVDWVSATLSKVGYKSPTQFKNWVLKNTQAKNFHVVIIAKGQGRSYAIPVTNLQGNAEKYYVEGVLLYEKNFKTGNNLSIGTAVHESLHLYGAWDLYETYKQTKEKADAARKRFPKSIMVTLLSDIKRQDVDELTAWLIGWNTEEKDWYEWFNPYLKH